MVVKNMRKSARMFIFTVVGITAAGMMFPECTAALAADDGSRASVWMDVIKKDYHPRLSVTVPTTFAFVVNGTKDTGNRAQISVEDGTLMLPNVTVDVLSEGDGKSGYKINVSNTSTLPIKNYSTVMKDKKEDNSPNYDESIREGRAVDIGGYIQNVGTQSSEQGYWSAVTDNNSLTDAQENFKNYRLELRENGNTHTFNTLRNAEADKIWMENSITLEKPNDSGGYTDGGFAKTPSVLELEMGVEIGGYRGQYTQIEQSVKAGKIIWTAQLK